MKTTVGQLKKKIEEALQGAISTNDNELTTEALMPKKISLSSIMSYLNGQVLKRDEAVATLARLKPLLSNEEYVDLYNAIVGADNGLVDDLDRANVRRIFKRLKNTN